MFGLKLIKCEIKRKKKDGLFFHFSCSKYLVILSCFFENNLLSDDTSVPSIEEADMSKSRCNSSKTKPISESEEHA